jgi:hypothetical protein
VTAPADPDGPQCLCGGTEANPRCPVHGDPAYDHEDTVQAVIDAWRGAGYIRDDMDPDVPVVCAWQHQAARVAVEVLAARAAVAVEGCRAGAEGQASS